MSANDFFSVAKEISDRFQSKWASLESAYQVSWHMRETAERVFFEILIDVVEGRNMPTDDVVEMLKVYLQHAEWIGLLVCDASPLNGNGSNGPTWALVRPRGILASLGGSAFKTIYEPLYDEHQDEENEEDWGDDDLSPEEQRKRSDRSHERYLETLFGLEPDEDNDSENQRITVLPEGFRNPLVVEHFANGGPGQEVVAVSRRTHMRDRTSSVKEWIEKHRNNKGVAASFDILTTAALDHHRKRPILRQLRSWTEDQFVTVVDTVIMMAAVWPEYLTGKITFVSGHHKSWIVVDQREETPLLFRRENKRINISLSRALARLSGLNTFRAMTCGFNLTKPGRVTYDGKVGKVLRLIAHNLQPSADDARRAIARLTQRLVDLGYDREVVRTSIADPIALGKLVDPEGTLLREFHAHPEHSLFAPPAIIKPIKPSFRPSGGRILDDRPRDRLYDTVGGNGLDDAYLSDGLWISKDGSISDQGR